MRKYIHTCVINSMKYVNLTVFSQNMVMETAYDNVVK